MGEPTPEELGTVREIVASASTDQALRALRSELAAFAAATFLEAGQNVHAIGHVLGSDRKEGLSPFGHGNDEAVGVSVLLRIAAQLISASADLLVGGRPYAGAALLRQIVEIEYLAWAFESRDGDAERWLRSDKTLREEFFRPAKLRKAAQGRFRGKDYGFHCELGGHPVPVGTVLLSDDSSYPQLLLSDLLGHVGRIWNHFAAWGMRNDLYGLPIQRHSKEMSDRFSAWMETDPLTRLPAPP
jgi:hypothetical protein